VGQIDTIVWRAAALVAWAMLAGCASDTPAARAPAPVPACPHVPPPKAEKPPRPPVSGFPQMLQPSHWDWDDGDYRWVPARWQVLLVPRTPRWVGGSWEAQGGACIWHSAHFSVGPASPP
jgi:hypothetical protein